ncbi:MAG: hypothetical protein ACYC8V_03260 [Caulobacteraceae bacterium]
MRLVTFTGETGARLGLAKDDGVIDLRKADVDLPGDMIGLISRWAEHRPTVERAASRAADMPLSAVTLQAPVPRPGKILAIGLNYADHIAGSGQKTPDQQVWFSKQANAVNGPFGP